MIQSSYECCIIGAGPAGMGAAVELCKHGMTDIVIIDRNSIVGGLCRTDQLDCARFDIGPHRFYTKNKEVNELWRRTLGADFKPVDRLTRIYYKNKYYQYPLTLVDVLPKFGLIESCHAMLSFASARVGRQKSAETFEDWVRQRFGSKLYEVFFKTYTEKIWGIPCSQIGADWAAQRIKDLNMIQLLKSVLFPASTGDGNVKTLVDQFDYPVLGAGQMYEAMCDGVAAHGVDVLLSAKVVAVHCSGQTIQSIDVIDAGGTSRNIRAKQYFSSIPMTKFFAMTQPGESDAVRAAAEALYYREHITVDLLVDDDELFRDQCIYIHSPDVKMARIANYNNFSKAMVKTPGKSAISVEYFAFQSDQLWKQKEDDLKALAADELEYLGLLDKQRIERSWVVRETECYPTYFAGYQIPYGVLKARLKEYTNLYCLGRAGMYKYNNQDHSILSGLLAARNYLRLQDTPFDLWKINIDASYLESGERPQAASSV